MKHRHIRRLPAAIAATGVLLVTAAVAIGATPTAISLALQGGTTQNVTGCKQLNHYQAYKVNTKMTMEGYVTPAPAFPDQAWKVKIKIKMCKAGKFVTVAQPHVLGNGVLVNGVKEGHFKYTRALKVKGFFFARAYYYTTPTTSIVSTDEHFHVTK
jgi:hypothetical protein